MDFATMDFMARLIIGVIITIFVFMMIAVFYGIIKKCCPPTNNKHMPRSNQQWRADNMQGGQPVVLFHPSSIDGNYPHSLAMGHFILENQLMQSNQSEGGTYNTETTSCIGTSSNDTATACDTVSSSCDNATSCSADCSSTGDF